MWSNADYSALKQKGLLPALEKELACKRQI